MGAYTSVMQEDSDDFRALRKPKMEDIPEFCVAMILSYLDPPEVARLAGVNRAFRAASSADFIWVSKLPSTSTFILSKLMPDQGSDSEGKRDFYARLCRHNPFDGGTKEVWIDKRTGGVCLAISSKAMTITGIDDRRYWNHIPTDESRFQTIAYLHQMWWLEVDGEVEFQLPAGTYSMFFRLQLGRACKRLGRRVCNSDNVHGWNLKPAHFQLATQDGQYAESRCMLDNLGSWVHYHMGDFVVKYPNESTKIKFSLTQIDCTHTKGGRHSSTRCRSRLSSGSTLREIRQFSCILYSGHHNTPSPGALVESTLIVMYVQCTEGDSWLALGWRGAEKLLKWISDFRFIPS